MRPLRLAAAILLVAGLAAGAAPAGAATPSLLFVQQAGGGTLKKAGSSYRLTLRGVAPSVASFTDRPGRTAGSERASTFVSRWRGRGFAADAPNAALVIDGAPRGRDLAVMSLSRPRYSARTRTFTYTAKPLKGKAGGALAAFESRRDPITEQRFGAASLFIDNAGALVFQPISLQVADGWPGQQVTVLLTSTGTDVGFSSGPPLADSAGVSIVSQSGALPLTRASLNASAISVATSGSLGGGTMSFTVNAYLVADPGISTFYLRTTSDPGVEVTAQVGNAVPQVVNQTNTLFSWNPF